MFDLQKFAGAGDSHTTEEAGWYLTTAYTFWYCPAGFEYVTDEGIDLDAIFLNYATNPSGWVISGLNNPDSHDNITGDTITAVIDATHVSSVDAITVEGDNKTSLHVVIGSNTYGVDSNGKLYISEETEETGTVIASSVVVTTTINGKKTSKNYNFANPNATNANLVSAITALNSLSDNSIVSIERVNKQTIG